jgi:excinuclease UvrABC ATPase subunit
MAADIYQIVKCPRCDGKGKIPHQMMFNAQTYRGFSKCDKCKGRGTTARLIRRLSDDFTTDQILGRRSSNVEDSNSTPDN